MDRRTFITTTSAAAVGLASSPISTTRAQQRHEADTDRGFWPNQSTAGYLTSMQFEKQPLQPKEEPASPFPPLDRKSLTCPYKKWYDYGFKEGIPRLLDTWDASASR